MGTRIDVACLILSSVRTDLGFIGLCWSNAYQPFSLELVSQRRFSAG
jgi:hypothetical protein